MKKFLIALIAILSITTTACADNFLTKIFGNSGSSSTGLNDLVNSVSSLIGGNNEVELSKITGTWKYYSPAVTFKSDNFLQKAGGTAASTTIVNKLKSYYSKAGLNKLQFTFNSDGTFNATAGKIKANGTITKNSNGSFTFNFKALDSVPAGSVTGYIESKGTNITVTFDASKLMDILSKVSSIAGNSTLSTVSTLVNSYDGMFVGFELKK